MVSKGVYRCHSVPLKKFLLENGLEYFNVDISETGRTYWDFGKTPRFKKVLDQWDELKKIKK